MAVRDNSRMRSRFWIAMALAVAASLAPSAQSKSYRADWNEPAPPHQVIGPVYFVGTNALASFLITTRSGHILLDPGFLESVPLIKNSIRALGFKYEDIRILLNSQAHYDHAAALALIRRETGARLAAMADDAPLLESGGRGDFVFGDEYLFPRVTVDRRLRDGDVIELGDLRLTARHTPGHTKGAATFFTTAIDRGQAYQVVFATSTTVNPGTMLVDNPKYPNIVQDWERTYAILESLSPGVWVSAHTNVFDMTGKLARRKAGDNPYVDPAGYRRHLAASRQRFAALLKEELVTRR
jgi:metallo-beta-lactamase class B